MQNNSLDTLSCSTLSNYETVPKKASFPNAVSILENTKKKEATSRNIDKLSLESTSQMVPLIYVDKKTNKTIVNLENSQRDKKKVALVKELTELRLMRNKVAQVIETALKKYDNE